MANPGDVSKLKKPGRYPDFKDYAGIIKSVQTTLMDKTGYELRARPNGMSPISEPAATLAANKKIGAEAVKKGEINTTDDTGYDIVQR
jgi:hypothetical protein